MTGQPTRPARHPAGCPAEVRCDDLAVWRGGRPALDGVTLHCRSGVVAVAGANGSGKSTLLQALAGLVPTRSGRIGVAGHDLTTRRGRRSARYHLGYLAQDADFPRRFTVAEAVAYGAWLHDVDDFDAASAAAIERAGLGSVAEVELRRLSGGMRQRALLAQATVHDPDVVLLDEPTVGLDVEHRHALREALQRHVSEPEPRRLVLLTTHLAGDLELADRVVVLRSGRVAFDGTPTDLATSHATDTATTEHDGPPIEHALRLIAQANDPPMGVRA